MCEIARHRLDGLGEYACADFEIGAWYQELLWFRNTVAMLPQIDLHHANVDIVFTLLQHLIE